jgi:hypothetical protein
VESRDPVAPLLRAFEEALDAGDRAALTALFDPSMAPDRVARYAAELLMPGAIDTTLRERARSQLEGAPPGDGYTIIIEFFIETAGRARILTASMDMQRPPGGEPSTWRFVGAEGLTFVEGLYRRDGDPSSGSGTAAAHSSAGRHRGSDGCRLASAARTPPRRRDRR